MSNPTWAKMRLALMNPVWGYNAEVRAWFKDADTNEARGSLRDECLISVGDSKTVADAKITIFRELVQKTHLRPEIYGIPVQSFQESVKFKPQVTLHFSQDMVDVDREYGAVTGEISFRIVNETSETMTPANAQALANRINTAFGQSNGFVWHKHNERYSYYDPEHGYNLQILATSETEAKRVIEQVLDIQSHTPNWAKHFRDATKRQDLSTSTSNPGSEFIYGESRKLPRHLPRADVRFRYAEMKLHGLANPVNLVDLSGLRINPLVRS